MNESLWKQLNALARAWWNGSPSCRRPNPEWIRSGSPWLGNRNGGSRNDFFRKKSPIPVSGRDAGEREREWEKWPKFRSPYSSCPRAPSWSCGQGEDLSLFVALPFLRITGTIGMKVVRGKRRHIIILTLVYFLRHHIRMTTRLKS